MSESTTSYINERLNCKKCPNSIEIKCVEKCAKWSMDLQISNKTFTQTQKISSNAVCTRNFKESLCKLLMSSNNNDNSLDFASLKSTYGNPFFSDIENLKPHLPIDQSNVNISSLGPEFFTFLVEVDLKKEKCERLNSLRKITPDFDIWEYQVFINSAIHSSKLLSKDFHIKLDTFKILKSIQFRIESYKTYLSNKSCGKKVKNDLFVKVLEEDINMGIIFSLPKNEPLDNLQTNIHNLLNSKIKINKIYFEIILPQSLFFSNTTTPPQKFIFSNNVIVSHFNQQKMTSSTVKKSNSEDFNHNLNDLIENNKKLLQNLKYSKISPRIKNEMSQIISQQLSENKKQVSQFTNINSNNNFSTNTTNAFSSFNLSNNPLQNNIVNRNRSFKSNIITRDLKVNTNTNSTITLTKTELFSSSSGSNSQSEMNILVQQNSGLSFNKFDVANKLKQQGNNSTSTTAPATSESEVPHNNTTFNKNTLYPKNKFEFSSKNKHMSCDFTNSKMMPTQHVKNAINFPPQNNLIPNNPLNQFINSQLNFDSATFNNKIKKNFQTFSSNHRIISGKRNSFPMINNEMSSNINICNWQIFMTNSTPLVNDTEDTPIKLFFEAFEKFSILGLECILKNSNTSILTNYDLTLSSLHIELGNNDMSYNYSTNYSSNSSKKPEVITSQNENSSSSLNNRIPSNNLTPPIIRGHNRTPSDINLNNSNNNLEQSFFSTSSIESVVSNEEFNNEKKRKNSKVSTSYLNFSEDQPHHNRQNFKQKIDEIFKLNPEYESLLLGDISENSFFSILWTPVKSTNNFQNQASFLVYYRFRGKSCTNTIKYLSVVGMISNKIDEEFWLTNQHLNYNPKFMNDFLYNKIIEDFFKNKYRYLQVNV